MAGQRENLAFARVSSWILRLAALTWVQVGYWHDPLTLWERALAVTRDNYIARDHLTSYYLKNNCPDQAMAQAVEAVRIRPGSPTPHYSLGVVLLTLGRNDEAAVALLNAVHIDPASADAWHNLGVARLRQGRPEQAAHSLEQALALEPGSADTRANLGLALWRSGHREEGLRAMQSALDLDPESADAWHGLGIAHLTQGRPEEATKALAQALRLNPELIGAYSNLGLALGRRGQWAGAVGCHRRAVAMQETFDKWLVAVHSCARIMRLTKLAPTRDPRVAVAIMDFDLSGLPALERPRTEADVTWLLADNFVRGTRFHYVNSGGGIEFNVFNWRRAYEADLRRRFLAGRPRTSTPRCYSNGAGRQRVKSKNSSEGNTLAPSNGNTG